MNYFKSNLKFLRKAAKLTQSDFANKIGVNRPIIGSYEEGRAEPKFETLQNISNYFQIAIDDLLEKRLDQGDQALKKNRDESDLRVLPIIVNKDNEERISMVPVKAAAGYMNGYADPEFVESLPSFNIPVPKFSQGTFRAFEIKGDSMLPIQSGSFVLAEYLENWSWVKDGECYIIVSKEDGVVYKRVVNQIEETNKLLLNSDNSEYDPYEIVAGEIIEIWKATGYISFDLPEKQVASSSVNELSEMMLKLKGEVEKLKQN